MSRTLASEIELSLISVDGSDSTLTWQGVDKRKTKKAKVVVAGGGGYYSREVIILNISV